ncbi:two-component system response regulator [Thermocoleostomius sinensis]|uniref:EAL domain-containing protein n=1 Tax=Thermocoleostomius sinensis A174 TaxID=2016057 RepID=A0A9E9C9C7_9CYAN|nr:EAL domain-containing protein [Thermocoleostomius sinensis]WAL59402.1 EAL domain-containing protein [Thermocoleostomius sinensis A174]
MNHLPAADILIVDDTPENLRLLSVMLSKQSDCVVRKALSGQAALVAAQTVIPDLILLDIMMPDMDGYQVCQHLKSVPATADIPIIFLSALNETFDKVKAFQLGAVDYITKPFQFEEVLTRVQTQLMLGQRSRDIRQLNAELEKRVEERTRQLEDLNRELIQEIIERKRVQSQLLEMAFYDALTGLPNRSLFIDRLNKEIKHTSCNSSYLFAVLFLDCDRFKVINDSLGHLVGDELLIAIAQRLQHYVKQTDTIARLGGDEFAILMPNVPNLDSAIQLAQMLLDMFASPFEIRQWQVFTGASVGIVLGHAGYTKSEHVLRDADTAMYRAKALGKAQYQVFDTAMHEAVLRLLQLETDMRRALEAQEFVLHYQPIVSLTTGHITGLEALLRWQHPQQGFISPIEFIPIAEETGLILSIGEWVIRTACQQLRNWQQQGLVDQRFSVSINLSARQFVQTNLIQQIDQILFETQISPFHLKLEITESNIMNNTKLVTSILKQLKKRRIHLSIDDFGTGYSSLSYLQAFPADSLKIDRSFIQRLTKSSVNSGLIPAIISIARAMQMSVVAEGIETLEQLTLLKHLNCELGQGYLFSAPLSIAETNELLIKNPCW